MDDSEDKDEGGHDEVDDDNESDSRSQTDANTRFFARTHDATSAAATDTPRATDARKQLIHTIIGYPERWDVTRQTYAVKSDSEYCGIPTTCLMKSRAASASS